MSQQLKEQIIVVGRFGGPHGVKGYAKVQTYTKPSANIIKYQPWQIKDNSGVWQKIELDDIILQHKHLLVKVAGITNPEDVGSLLTHKEIAVCALQLPKLNKGDYYWKDLKGLVVRNKAGIYLGVVIDLLETGSNDVLILENEEKQQRLIPYLPDDVILEIDVNNKHMLVDWDENF